MYGQLKRIIDLESDFAPAYIQLAKLDLAKRDFRLALAMSRKAEQLEPFRAGYRVFTGKILLLMDHPTEVAAKAAYVAQRWSGPDRDEAMELWNRIPISQRQVNAPDLPEPDAKWHTAEGIVKQVSCNGMAFAISLDVKGETGVFKSDGFPVGYSDTFWVGRDHFSPCFHVQGLRVVLKYKPPKDNSYTGDLVYAGFRDDLVASDARTAKTKAPAAN
jgi:hypothetical protein